MIPVTAIPESQYQTLLAIGGVIWGTHERVKVQVKGNEIALECIWESVSGSK